VGLLASVYQGTRTSKGDAMQEFTRTIKREITFPSSDPKLPPARWIVEIGAGGVVFRKKNQRAEDCHSMSWRSLLSLALIYGAKNRNAEKRNEDADLIQELLRQKKSAKKRKKRAKKNV